MSINTVEIGQPDRPPVVFAHGWARTHADFMPIAELIAHTARVILLDLPGFGESPRPDTDWDTNDYADHVHTHLQHNCGIDRFIWVGHSFGGRVGLRLAALRDTPVDALVLVAGAGVRTPPPLLKKIRGRWKSRQFQKLKSNAHSEEELIELERQFGSPDYVQSRELGLRDIFIKTIQEDQSESAKAITCPTTLIYGAKDFETPPAEGRILNAAIRGSSYVECPEYDHHSILTRGRHQVALALKEAIAQRDDA